MRRTMRIDVHAHLWSEQYLEQLGGGGEPTQAQRGLGAGATDEDLAARLAQMDAAGVDVQILSATPFSPHLPDEAAAVRAARTGNDEYTAVVAEHPDRFRAFAALPLPHVDASVKVLTRALDALRMARVGSATPVARHGLASPAL